MSIGGVHTGDDPHLTVGAREAARAPARAPYDARRPVQALLCGTFV